MPAIIAALVAGLVGALPALVWRVLAALGVGFITYQGVDLLLTNSEAKVFAALATMNPVTVSLFGILKVGQCIKVWTAAMGMRATLAGISGGNMRKMVQKG